MDALVVVLILHNREGKVIIVTLQYCGSSTTMLSNQYCEFIEILTVTRSSCKLRFLP